MDSDYKRKHHWIYLTLDCLPPIDISYCRDCHAKLGEAKEGSICPGEPVEKDSTLNEAELSYDDMGY